MAAAMFPMTVPGGGLEDYVVKKDAAFAHRIVEEAPVMGLRVVKVRLTSQKWQGREWRHWLTVLVPPMIGEHRKAILIIDGGSNHQKMPGHNHQAVGTIGMSAMMLRAPVALLQQVPNQPLYGNLREDDLIAHSFDQYLMGGGADWPLLLPMVKSATAAMSALQELAAAGKLGTAAGREPGIDKFIVGGASKRGWTTWLTAAVDARVCALAPSVIDVLNMPEQLPHQKRSYGTYSHMLRPYEERGILERFDTPRGKDLLRIVDPFAYRDRITQPKLMLLGSNDPYWTVDAAQLYYPELSSPKALFYLPNAGHNLGLGAVPTLNNFLASVLEEKPFPQLHYEMKEGSLEVSWKGKAGSALWTADSPNRDFRRAKWTSRNLPIGERTVVTPGSPSKGWRAAFVTVTFPGIRAGDPPFGLSTPVHVVPEAFPHK